VRNFQILIVSAVKNQNVLKYLQTASASGGIRPTGALPQDPTGDFRPPDFLAIVPKLKFLAPPLIVL